MSVATGTGRRKPKNLAQRERMIPHESSRAASGLYDKVKVWTKFALLCIMLTKDIHFAGFMIIY